MLFKVYTSKNQDKATIKDGDAFVEAAISRSEYLVKAESFAEAEEKMKEYLGKQAPSESVGTIYLDRETVIIS